jgi:hypothetical protein
MITALRNQTMDGERQLQGVEECTTIAAIKTLYNSDSRVPPYVGIMFEIFPKMDLELLTLELDLTIPNGVTDADLSVEVYTMDGSFELLKAYSPSGWTQIADATATLLPGGQGAIIPSAQFTPLKLEAEERRSFYVTMKKPYLDHTVMALQKTGELQMRTPELDILVGVGYNEYKFSEEYDRLLDPQFAGVLHVRRTADCALMVTTTTVEYNFLVEQETSTELLSEVSDAMNNAMEKLMQANPVLKGFQKDFDLKISELARSGRKEYEGTLREVLIVSPMRSRRSLTSLCYRICRKLSRCMEFLPCFLSSNPTSVRPQRRPGEWKLALPSLQSC